MINDHELLAMLVRLIIGIVEKGVSGIMDCEGNSAVMRFTNTFTGKKDGIRAR